MTVPLPIPDDPELSLLIDKWPTYSNMFSAPRSKWLRDFESILRRHYPRASSDELTLTARNLAPFPLAKPGVP